MFLRRNRQSTSLQPMLVLLLLCALKAAARAADATEVIENITVTAQKREQNLSDVPVAVTVLRHDTIDASAPLSIEEAQSLVPSLTFQKGGTTRNSALVVRGMGTISFSIGAEPSVSTVVDGVVMSRSGQAFFDFYDIAQIEVLRGPQGTIFGKNASAGVLSITTLEPTDHPQSIIDIAAFENREYTLRTSFSGPLSESLNGRLSLFHGDFDGYIKNAFDGDTINGYRKRGVRGQLHWLPVDSLRLKAIVDWSESDADCCGEFLGTLPQESVFLASLNGAQPDGKHTRVTSHDDVTRTRDRHQGIAIQADIILRQTTLTALSAFRQWDNTEWREGDFLSVGPAYVNDTSAGLAGPIDLRDIGPQTWKQWSQEVRIASNTYSALEWLGGLFLWQSEVERRFSRFDEICIRSSLPMDATGQRPCDQSVAGTDIIRPSATAEMDTRFQNYALFGQLGWWINENLQWHLGGRYTYDRVEYRHRRLSTDSVVRPGIQISSPRQGGSVNNSNLSAKTGLSWAIRESTMVYISYSQGYKGPAFNVFFNQLPEHRAAIEAETSDAFELGIKSSVFGNRLLLNLAAYYMETDNYQANNYIYTAGVQTTNLTNAGSVLSRGLEFDMLARLNDHWEFSGGFALINAHIKKFDCRHAPDPTSCDDRSGEDLPFAPHASATLAGEYRKPLGELELIVYTQANWLDDQYADFGEDPRKRIDSYWILNGSISLSFEKGKYRFSLEGRNLADNSYLSTIQEGGPGGSLRVRVPRNADRYFGLRFKVKF